MEGGGVSELKFGSLDRLEMDIEFELAHLWEDLGEFKDTETRDLATAIARAAWGFGYARALLEPERGQFLRDHGYKIPPRRAA